MFLIQNSTRETLANLHVDATKLQAQVLGIIDLIYSHGGLILIGLFNPRLCERGHHLVLSLLENFNNLIVCWSKKRLSYGMCIIASQLIVKIRT